MPDGRSYYDYIVPGDNPKWKAILRQASYNTDSVFKVEYGKDDNSFQIFVIPKSLPPVPFNFLTQMPSFRADQTGEIRMCFVQTNGEVCSNTAPVVHTVVPKDALTLEDLKHPWWRDELMEHFARRDKWAWGRLGW